MSSGDEDPIESSSLPSSAPLDPSGAPPPGLPIGKKRRRGKWIVTELVGLGVFLLLFTWMRPSINHVLFHSTSRVPSQASSTPAASGSFTPTLTEESSYLSDMQVFPYFSGFSKNQLLAIGLRVCSDLTAGRSSDAVLLDLQSTYQLSPSGPALQAAQMASLDLCSSYFMSFQ